MTNVNSRLLHGRPIFEIVNISNVVNDLYRVPNDVVYQRCALRLCKLKYERTRIYHAATSSKNPTTKRTSCDLFSL